MLSRDNLHPYQDDSITQLYNHDRILGIMPTGAGKTVSALTAFEELRRDGHVRQGVILAPKRVAGAVWPHEAAKWEHLQDVHVCAPGETKAQRKKALDDYRNDLIPVGIDNIKWLLEQVNTWDPDDPRLDLLIVDESSRFKKPGGAHSTALFDLVGWDDEENEVVADRFQNVWLLTGTPRPNSEADWWTQMQIVSREELWSRDYHRFLHRHFYTEPEDWEKRNWIIHPHAVEDIRNDVAKYSFKVPIEAVPRPASDPIIHNVELPTSARSIYRNMARKKFASLPARDIIAYTMAVATGKLVQAAQGFMYDDDKKERGAHPVHDVKMAMLLDLLASMEGDPCAIVYWFKEDLVRLKAVIPGLVWLGDGVGDKQTLEIERDWNAGRIERLAIHPASAGHGLNLQGVQCQLVHYALTWSAELYEQTVARFARQGYVGSADGKWQLLNHHIVALDTIDEAMIDRIQGKLTAQAAAMKYVRSVAV